MSDLTASNPFRASAMRWPDRRLLLILSLLGLAVCFPWLGLSNRGLTVACQIGINAIFAASFHLMFGLAGMLWFGHAVFFGVAAYTTAYLLLGFAARSVPYVPVSLLPLLGAAAAMLVGALLGWIVTRREKLAFAMISLAVSELAVGLSYVFRSVSGGEEGLSVDRWVGPEPLGITFGPQREVYFLTLAWLAASLILIAFLQGTALGRAALASRENAERLRFLGYDVRRVRWLVFVLSSAFAGVAGSLFAINYEHVGVSLLSLEQSAIPLFAVVIGGLGSLIGAVAGAAILTLLSTLLSDLTPAWLLYLGLVFTAVVLFARDGLAGAMAAHSPLWARSGSLPPSLVKAYAVAAAAVVAFAACVIGLGEALLAHGTASAARPAALLWLVVAALALGAAVWTTRRAAAAYRQAIGQAGLVATDGAAHA